ncbi:hypothetical protein F441_04920 [Phytophthora nicotianae CJ01A1]|uniref:Uncharacterized protein n=7 Tax=Phytophthora nicotianae TaxID=4792 RepID=W2QHG1_PHYN3|nr:hypothetical protein PPTG_09148 [Phytophthora nicotianae INRA-310]ETI51807.1 hypothetical protein F443_04919 [Phytophthora nicotianae P1569]ETK91703.1 hypothetical protein L915_04788 [Phytophthora nicotianae]ETO80566.1 hypothetical protein F444_04962 [Phytophthora nicotianae P1976]ETP21605.1 hypothetical protein F441_04920 [Phytophthora nicotianae CJ01A1]ETP49510.1 hypothetical protein F442_04982 [Phytophthora nicotianae P10297]
MSLGIRPTSSRHLISQLEATRSNAPTTPLEMTALLVKSSWKQHEPAMPIDDIMPDNQLQEARAWTHKLRHSGESASTSPKPTDAVLSPTQITKPMVVETSSKKHRFSLRRLFKHDNNHEQGKKAAFVPPVPIPSDFLTRERHGGVTVSGKRVPFTRDAHKRRKKTVRPMPRINEDRALLPVSSSVEAYRRRAYYPAKKEKSKK